MIDAIARGKLGLVIAGRNDETTPIGRAEVHAWVDQRDDQQSSRELSARLRNLT